MSSEDFKSLIVTDPDLVDEGIDVSNLRTTTDTSPFLLGNIPDYSGIQYDYLGPTKYSDLMRLYMQGLPMFDTPQAATPPSGGGSGDAGQATLPVFDDPTPEPIAGFDPGVTPGPSGFIGLDPDMDIDIKDYDDAQTYEPPTPPSSDPFLASGAAGGARLPTDTGIMVEDLTQPSNVGDFQITGASPLTNQTGIIDNAVDPQAVKTILGPDGITYNAVTGQPIYEDLDAQAAATDVVTQEDIADNTSLLQKLGLPADFDIKRAAIEAGINLAVGVPITLIGKALGAILPDRDPRQTALDEMYDVKDGTIQSGLMKGYNPVSGNPLDPNYGLQDAYQKRIDTINKTLGGMTLEQYQNTDLVQRKKDLEEAMAKEKTMLDQLQYGDPEKIAAGIQTADDDSGSEMLDTTPKDDIFGFKDLDDQVVYSDYQDIGETSDSYNYPDRKQLVDSGTITPLEDDFEFDDMNYEPPAPPSPPTGTDRPGGDDRDDSPAPSAPSAPTGTNRPGGDSRDDSPSSSPATGGGANMGTVSTKGPPSQSSVSTPTGISSAYSSYQNAPTSVGGGGGGGGGGAEEAAAVAAAVAARSSAL